jgi:dihydroorotase
MLTSAPAALFSMDREGVGSLRIGAPADVCVIDMSHRWRVDRNRMRSRSRNTPFHGLELEGIATLTLLGGRVVHDLEGRSA